MWLSMIIPSKNLPQTGSISYSLSCADMRVLVSPYHCWNYIQTLSPSHSRAFLDVGASVLLGLHIHCSSHLTNFSFKQQEKHLVQTPPKIPQSPQPSASHYFHHASLPPIRGFTPVWTVSFIRGVPWSWAWGLDLLRQHHLGLHNADHRSPRDRCQTLSSNASKLIPC